MPERGAVLVNYPEGLGLRLDCVFARYSALKALEYAVLATRNHFGAVRSAVGQVAADVKATDIGLFINADVPYPLKTQRQLDTAHAARATAKYVVQPFRIVPAKALERELQIWLPKPHGLEPISRDALESLQAKPILGIFPQSREYASNLAQAFGFLPIALDLQSCADSREREQILKRCRPEMYGGLVYVSGILGEPPLRTALDFRGRLWKATRLSHALGKLRSALETMAVELRC